MEIGLHNRPNVLIWPAFTYLKHGVGLEPCLSLSDDQHNIRKMAPSYDLPLLSRFLKSRDRTRPGGHFPTGTDTNVYQARTHVGLTGYTRTWEQKTEILHIRLLSPEKCVTLLVLPNEEMYSSVFLYGCRRNGSDGNFTSDDRWCVHGSMPSLYN